MADPSSVGGGEQCGVFAGCAPQYTRALGGMYVTSLVSV
jgi:hypothetical protein